MTHHKTAIDADAIDGSPLLICLLEHVAPVELESICRLVGVPEEWIQSQSHKAVLIHQWAKNVKISATITFESP